MADELDDRLRELARDAETLVVIGGPQAVRTRGKRRRARRRAAAAGVAAALALAVGGWQLLPRLDRGPDTGAVPPAGTAAVTPDPVQTALQDRLDAELLPADVLPYADKWQWAETTSDELGKVPPPCSVGAQSGSLGQATRQYLASSVPAVADYHLYAFTDATTAAVQANAMRKQMTSLCGIPVPPQGDPSNPAGWSAGYGGRSKSQTGVTVWVENQGPYVAVLSVRAPGDPTVLLKTGAVEKCIARSLARLGKVGSPAGAEGTGKGTARATAGKGAAGTGGVRSTDSC